MAAEYRRQLSFRRHLAFCALAFMVHQVASKFNSHSKASNTIISASALQLSPILVNSNQSMDEESIYLSGAANKSTKELSSSSSLIRGKRFSNIEDSTLKSPMNDDDDDFNIIRDMLDFIGYYLPTLNLNFTITEQKSFVYHQLDVDVEDYYEERYRRNLTLDELQFEAIKAAMRLAPMPLHTSWGYESRDQLRVSSWPVRDEFRCAAHLNQLANRLAKLNIVSPSSSARLTNNPIEDNQSSQTTASTSLTARSRHNASPIENFEAQLLYKSNDIQFLRYLDTFGHVPSDLLRGNVKWYGSYSGCLDTKLNANLNLGGTKRIKFRYCMAALKSVGWTNSFISKQKFNDKKWSDFGVHTADFATGSNLFIRLGVCLPESCDSSAFDYQENVENIEKLAKFNLMKPFNSDHYYLSDLYCLPDQRSPLVTIPLAGKLLILVTLLWLSLILMATTVHLNVERFYRKVVKEIRQKKAADKVTEPGKEKHLRKQHSSPTDENCDDEIVSDFDESDNNQFKESDILELKRNWIRLNVYIFDHSKKFIEGVDLIACLSLYSNWLKYTKRLKLAVAQLHAEEERHERCRIRNQKLVDRARIGARITSVKTDNRIEYDNSQHSRHTTNLKLDDNVGREKLQLGSTREQQQQQQQQIKSSNSSNLDNVSSGSSQHLTNSAGNTCEQTINEQVERELNKRLEAKDELDEYESDFVKRRVDTSSLNALKVIALIWIIAGHCIFYLGSTISNGAILKNYVRDLSAFALANGAMYITELFFVITGCLTAYLAFKYNTFKLRDGDNNSKTTNEDKKVQLTMSKRRQSRAEIEASEHVYLESRMFKIPFWISIAINRYLRIMPAYLFVYSFVKLINVYVGGSGQTWDYAVGANSMRRKCVQESWWPVLTLTTNFVSIYEHCIVGGWYLSVDMQFMILAIPCLLILAYCQRNKQPPQLQLKPPKQHHFAAFNNNKQPGQQLTILTTSITNNNSEQQQQQQQLGVNNLRRGLIATSVSKRVYFGYLIVFAAGLLSALISIIHGVYQSETDLSIILKFVPHTVAILTKNIAMYTNSLFRLRAFAFGLILGHLLYLYEFKLIKLPKFIQQHGAKVTSIVFAVGFCIMFSPVLYPKGKILISHDMTAILMILTAGGIDLFLCTLIFLICIGKAPKMVLFFLNSPFWSVLSSLSLCAFLIHTEVIVVLSSQLNPPPTVQYSLLLFVFSATLIITYILALGLYLCFEMPLGRLIEAFMRKYLGNSKLVKSDNPTVEGEIK